jgi:hypothetical protein
VKKSASAKVPRAPSAEWDMEQLNDDLDTTESSDKDSVDGWCNI